MIKLLFLLAAFAMPSHADEQACRQCMSGCPHNTKNIMDCDRGCPDDCSPGDLEKISYEACASCMSECPHRTRDIKDCDSECPEVCSATNLEKYYKNNPEQGSREPGSVPKKKKHKKKPHKS